MKKKLFLMVSSIALACSSAVVNASTSTETVDEQQNIEVIEVVGNKSLLYYRNQVRKAENKVINLFNAANELDDYDIKCERTKHTKTNIKTRKCELNIESEIMFREMQFSIAAQGIIGSVNMSPMVTMKRIEASRAKYRELALELLQKNPELAKAFTDYNNAIDRFHQRRTEVFAGMVAKK